MARNQDLRIVSFVAASDLSSAQFTFMSAQTTDDQIDQTGAGALAAGVLQNDPASGETAAVAVQGSSLTKVVAGGSVTAGDDVASDASGRAVTAATGDEILGTCIVGAGAAGELCEILFHPRGILA